jgi:hypothetical protein
MEQKIDILKVIGIVADIVTISGITFLTIWSSIRKDKEVFAFKINLYLTYFLRSVGIIISANMIFLLINEPYTFFLALFKGQTNGELWESGKEVQHLLSYFASTIIGLSILWIIGTIIWTSSFKYALDFFNVLLPGKPFRLKLQLNPKLDILSAIYGSDTNVVDLTETLRQMIKDEKLKVVANNSLGGDPHPGVVKKLKLTYRKGLLPKTIEVVEGGTIEIENE